MRDFDDPKGGKFEVKAALGAAEVLSVGPQARGRADTWVKWSLATDNFKPWVAAITSGEGAEKTWVEVHKERLLRKFSLDAGLLEVSLNARPIEGCIVELVSLHVDGSRWVTFGFE